MEKSLAIGTILKSPTREYEIRSVLGSGGFGITYSATFMMKVNGLPIQAVVAIKEHFLSADCEREKHTQSISYSQPVSERVERSRRDFVGEARRLQNVAAGHNNIIQVSEIFDANNTSYYVMEYLEGQTLGDYVKNQGKLDEAETLSIMCPIIEAVAYLHENKITHLDIKPSNIMLARIGNKLRPVLIDFGLSKHYNEDGSATSTINTQGFSEGYAPVEQYVGITSFSPASDIYSLAATIMFCLNGCALPRSLDLTPEKLITLMPAAISPSLHNALVQSLQRFSDARLSDANSMLKMIGAEPSAATDAESCEEFDESADISTQLAPEVSAENKPEKTLEPKTTESTIISESKFDQTIFDSTLTPEIEIKEKSVDEVPGGKRKLNTVLIILFVVLIIAGAAVCVYIFGYGGNSQYVNTGVDSVAVEEAEPILNELVVDGYKLVDLGLPSGKLWAKWNVGANTPESGGSYFSWDERGSAETPSLRVPSKEDFEELINNCTVENYVLNGVNGRLFTSIINDNSIFLPAVGFMYDGTLEYNGDECEYWSSELCSSDSNQAYFYAYYPSDTSVNIGQTMRTIGMNIRLVGDSSLLQY